jgi:hypothetical protein
MEDEAALDEGSTSTMRATSTAGPRYAATFAMQGGIPDLRSIRKDTGSSISASAPRLTELVGAL